MLTANAPEVTVKQGLDTTTDIDPAVFPKRTEIILDVGVLIERMIVAPAGRLHINALPDPDERLMEYVSDPKSQKVLAPTIEFRTGADAAVPFNVTEQKLAEEVPSLTPPEY